MSTKIRSNTYFNHDWLFKLGEVENGQLSQLDDSDFRPLELPHDWAIEHEIKQDSLSNRGAGYAIASVGWYRKHFEYDNSWDGKKVSLLFDGVMQFSSVYLNDTLLCEQDCGYTTFEVDLTPYLVKGKNTLAVRVDNSDQPNSRWYTGSGIYRNVSLIVTNKIHIDTWGIFIMTNNIHPELDIADFELQTHIQNETDTKQKVKIKHFIYDHTGKQVSYVGGQIITKPHEKGVSIVIPQIENYRLWSIEDPYLYTLKTEIYCDDEMVDDYELPIGIRLCEFDCDKGFSLNGKQVKVKGMCLHHDCGVTGAVGFEESWVRRLNKLKDMGCNAIRCSHNPPTKEFLDLCDKMGFLVMDEAFDEWFLGKLKNYAEAYSIDRTAGYNMNFHCDARKDLEAMILRDRNHPSIFIWSIGNEILEQHLRYGSRVVKFLQDICHELDPSRLVTSACSAIQSAKPMRAFREFENELDVVGYNYTGRWRERAQTLNDEDRALYPKRIVIGTENPGAGGIRGDYSISSDLSKEKKGYRDYTRVTNEHEHLWKYIATHDFVSGDFPWTGIDYLGEADWPRKGADCAPIDTAGFEKDTYYYFRSIWNNKDTTLHIAPHWNWEGKEGEFIPVIVYTNCEEVSLFLNGKFISHKGSCFPRYGALRYGSDRKSNFASTTNDLHLSWDVPYIPGELKAVGYNKDGEVIATTIIRTAKAPAKIEVVADKEVTKPNEYVNLEISLSDEDNLHVPTATDTVEITMQKGTLFGMDNGSPFDLSLFKENHKDLFAGKVLALVRAGDDGIECTIKCKGLTKHVVIK